VNKKVEQDPKMKKQLDRRYSLIEGCENDEVKKIMTQHSRIMASISIVNLMAWLPVFIPILIAVVTFTQLKRALTLSSEKVILVRDPKIRMSDPGGFSYA
jgi:hypothetical protein